MREHSVPNAGSVRLAARSRPSVHIGLRLATVLGVLALSAALAAPGAVWAVPPTLSNGTVSPSNGTTSTIFVFAVTYSGSKAASSVVALVANRSIPLSLVLGTADNGRFNGSALLPAGTWQVVFQASTTGAVKPLFGPIVLVTPPPPPPTPQPTAAPTPVASPTATPSATRAPTSAPPPIAPTPLPSGAATPSAGSGESTSSAEPTPFGTTVAGESATGRASASPSGGASAGNGDVEQQLTTVLTGGLVAVGLLGAIGFAAIYADRRRRAAASSAAGLPEAQSPPPGPSARARSSRRGGWEDYALDNEPIGTVEPDPESPSTDE